MRYEIIITAKYKKRKRALKRIAKKYRLVYHGWCKDHFICTGTVSEREYRKLQSVCARKRVKIKLQNQFATRSTNYRQTFFEKNPPVWKDRYFCAYCGRLIHKKNITVDHLYPVNSAQESIKMQKKLKKKGWDTINDDRNLVAACDHCNKSKSSRMGKWIILGTIGRYSWLWVIRHIIRIILLIWILIQLHNMGFF